MSVVTDRPARQILRVRIDRPDARNAIDQEVRKGLLNALFGAIEDPEIKAVILGGTGGIFSAGGDLPSLVGLSREQAFERLRDGHKVVSLLWELPKPVVAAVERYAVGAGAGLALLADRVVIGESAVFSFPFAKLGLRLDWGLSGTLPLRVGAIAARRLYDEASSCRGGEAAALGLADIVARDDAVAETALAEAQRLALLPAAAFASEKSLRRGRAETELGLKDEAHAQAQCIASPAFVKAYEAWRSGGKQKS